MKILFFHRWVGVHSGGTETHLIELAKRFSKLGHDISILTREGSMLNDISNGIRVIKISRNWKESDHSYENFRVYIHTALFMLKSAIKLFSLYFSGARFDIISVHFVTEAIVANFFRFFTQTPIVFVLEGYTPLEAAVAKYADLRIAISKFEADVYKQKNNVDSKVIYIGIDPKKFLLDKKLIVQLRSSLLKDADFLVLTVCRLEPRKDIFTLLMATATLSSSNRRIKFIIVGDGISRSTIASRIKDMHLEDSVKLIGQVNDSELGYYYKAVDVFLLTSREEWFGIVFLEAMAAGLPVLATEATAASEIVDGCGLFFEKGDYRDLAEKLLRLVSDLGLRNSLSDKSIGRAKEFNWDRQILQYEAAYKSVLN